MFKTMMTLLMGLVCFAAQAAFVPMEKSGPEPQVKTKGLQISKETFEKAKGKKLNFLDRLELKIINKRLSKGKMTGIFPERDDLTEGFQFWPFFGTMITGGLLAVIMLFTAKDRNALRWASIGLTTLLGLVGLITLLTTTSGY